MRVLQREFSKKEKAERLLSNLEKLKSEGAVADDQYEALRQKYSTAIELASDAITTRKEEMKVRLEEAEKSLVVYEQELKNLEVKFKVGELQADQYQREEQRNSLRLARAKQDIAKLQQAIASTSSEGVGGFIDVDLEAKGAAAKLGEIEVLTGPIELGAPGTVQGYIQDAINVIKNPMIFFERMRVGTGLLEPIIFGGVVCFITVFLLCLIRGVTLQFGILNFISLLLDFAVMAVVILIMTKLLQGEGNLESSVRIAAYSILPIVVWFIPYNIGILISLYGVYIMFAGMQKLHSLTAEKSAVAVFVTVVIYALLLSLLR